MIRLNLHYDVAGWAYHRRCLALAKHAPADFQVAVGPGRGPKQYGDCDLALQLCYTHVRDLRKTYRDCGAKPLIVAGLNVGWSARTSEHLATAIIEADHVVVNSRDCWERSGRPEGSTWISNGVDRREFSILASPAQRRPKLLWTGSAFHRRLKGFDDLVVPLFRRLWRERRIETDARLVDSHGGLTRWTPDQMCQWYNTGTVYVCASESEGTPNPALEAASAGCVVCSTRVGNMPELIADGLNGRLVDRTLDGLYAGICDCLDRYAEMQAAMEPVIAGWDWSIRAAEYFGLFRRLLGVPASAG